MAISTSCEVLILNGASPLGSAIALEFAKAGFRPVLLDEPGEPLEQAVDRSLMISGRGSWIPVRLLEEGSEKVASRAARHPAGFGVWVNNPSSHYWENGTAERQPAEAEAQRLRTGLEAAIAYFSRRSQGGVIINVISPSQGLLTALRRRPKEGRRLRFRIVTALIRNEEEEVLLQNGRIVPPEKTAAAHRVARDVVALAHRPRSEAWAGGEKGGVAVKASVGLLVGLLLFSLAMRRD